MLVPNGAPFSPKEGGTRLYWTMRRLPEKSRVDVFFGVPLFPVPHWVSQGFFQPPWPNVEPVGPKTHTVPNAP